MAQPGIHGRFQITYRSLVVRWESPARKAAGNQLFPPAAGIVVSHDTRNIILLVCGSRDPYVPACPAGELSSSSVPGYGNRCLEIRTCRHGQRQSYYDPRVTRSHHQSPSQVTATWKRCSEMTVQARTHTYTRTHTSGGRLMDTSSS